MSYFVKDPANGNSYLTVGTTPFTVPVSSPGKDIAWITFLNESPYLLFIQSGSLQFEIPSGSFYPLMAPDAEGVDLPITISPLLITQGIASSAGFVLVVTVYGVGESPPQRLPYSLGRVEYPLSTTSSVTVPNKTTAFPITVTTQQTVVTYTPSIDVLVRVAVYIRVNNAVSGQLLSVNINYRDPSDGLTAQLTLRFLSASAGSFAADGATSFVNGNYTAWSEFFRSAAGVPIQVLYRDPGGTPNDQVSVTIEQFN